MTRLIRLHHKCMMAVAAILLLLPQTALFAEDDATIGNVIQINAHLRSFVGKPSWLLLIRDLDHNENIPYVYDFTRSDNQWLAFTYSHHYLIVASTLRFTVYRPRSNTYRTYHISNFCHLESQGRIQRDVSLSLWISGDLWPGEDGYQCNINRYLNSHFAVAHIEDPCPTNE